MKWDYNAHELRDLARFVDDMGLAHGDSGIKVEACGGTINLWYGGEETPFVLQPDGDVYQLSLVVPL